MDYKEKLKLAKEALDSGSYDKETIEYIFPELTESEDERIGKEIISYLKRRLKMDSSIPAAIDYWINWLEKQVEHAKFRDSIQIGDQVTKNQDGILVNLSQLKRFAKPAESKKHDVCDNCDQQGGCVSPCPMKLVEKHGEQKPNYCHHEVDLSNCSEEYRKAYYDGWNNCNIQHSQCKLELDGVIKCLINGMKFYYGDSEEVTWGTDKWSMPVEHIIEVLEKYDKQQDVNIQINPSEYINDMGGNGCYLKNTVQTSAWSEEDEDYYDAIIAKLEVTQEDATLTDNQMDFLRSLKGKMQPKQEWSEEDKEMYKKVETAINSYYAPFSRDAEEMSEWFKNLKDRVQPQNTWKPSKEQMDNLSRAFNGATYNNSLLMELYIDLKKLREELL